MNIKDLNAYLLKSKCLCWTLTLSTSLRPFFCLFSWCCEAVKMPKCRCWKVVPPCYHFSPPSCLAPLHSSFFLVDNKENKRVLWCCMCLCAALRMFLSICTHRLLQGHPGLYRCIGFQPLWLKAFCVPLNLAYWQCIGIVHQVRRTWV